MEKVQIGTVIHGTLRDEDLIPAFQDELARITNDAHPMLVEINRPDAESVNELIDALNEYAPPHTYFGAHPGDGSDFGFWPVHTASFSDAN